MAKIINKQLPPMLDYLERRRYRDRAFFWGLHDGRPGIDESLRLLGYRRLRGRRRALARSSWFMARVRAQPAVSKVLEAEAAAMGRG
ncbi:MAG: hypothetical protein R3E50_06190 [Halioglobus sp.]